MEAVILAGGLGKRLSPVIKDLPKPMAPVREKPFLEYILEWLIGQEISKIVIAVGYKADNIITYFGKSFHEIPVEYSLEAEPLGTGGGLVKAMEKIDGDDFIALNGDTYFPVNLVEFIEGHKAMRSDITIALKMMRDFSRYGAVELDPNGSITRFNEKEFRRQGLINGGIYCINKKFLEGLYLPERFSLENDVLEKHTMGNVKGMVFHCPFIDIGVPGDYYNAQLVL